MKAFWRLLGRDIVRLLKTPAAVCVVLVLIVLPSLYTWYNVVAFWNPYDNTGNLRVCVVNEDAGGESDVTGYINVGDLVVDALHEDTQLGWTFTDYDTAMDELESGKSYAAFVIPEDFTSNLLTITTGSFTQPELQYYVNEKSAPVSPKIMDAGSTELDRTINSMFRATVGDVVVGVIDDAVDSSEAAKANMQARASTELGDTIDTLTGTRAELAQANQAFEDGKDTVADAKGALSDAQSSLDDASTLLTTVSNETLALQQSLSGFSSRVSPGVPSAIQQMAQVSADANTAISQLSSSLAGTQAEVSAALARAQASLAQSQQLASDMRTLAASLDDSDPTKQQLEDAADGLDQTSANLQEQIENLRTLNDSLTALNQQVKGASDSANAALSESIAAQAAVSSEYFNTTLPAIDASLSDLALTTASLSSIASQQTTLIGEADVLLDQLSDLLNIGQEATGQTDGLLADTITDLDKARTDILSLDTSGTIARLLGDGTIDANSVASFIGEPTHVRTEQLYPLASYGSAMAPLFMNLTFWIGAFMLLVVMRQEVDTEGVEGASLTSRFMARFVFFGVIVVLQAVVCCAGLMFLGTDPVHPTALFVASALTSLAYLCIIYSLSVTLQHVGKGLCVILVFAQIPGASGLYPIEMTSQFFQNIAPFFPFTYGIGAMREAICGFYGYDYFIDLLVLFAFAVIFLFIGIKVRPLLSNVNRMFAEQIHQSGIFNGERVDEPYRPYRIAQIIGALSEKETFRDQLVARYERFSRRYPHIIRIVMLSNIVVPVITIVVLALTPTEKVTVLTIWILWLIATFIAAIAVESFERGLERQLKLNDMTDAGLIDEFRLRGSADAHEGGEGHE